MNLSFKNRISFFYLIATSIIIAIVFSIVFYIVEQTVYQNLDRDLSFEANKHTGEIKIIGDSIKFINKSEWEENEHREVQVNPVFIQLIDAKGRLMDKSPNLKGFRLENQDLRITGDYFDTYLNNRVIRQVQIPIKQAGKIKGYIVAAMSLESSKMVILNLRNVLLISFPIILLGLFFVSRELAGRSIIPIKNIRDTTNIITKNNLNERVILPENKDELYDLSASINELLARIEKAIERERQFTSDASHELRTPIAVLKGTLEVLIRKPRSQQEYEEKIKLGLVEIDRMTETLEQLLELARFDSASADIKQEKIALATIINEIISTYSSEISQQSISLFFDYQEAENVLVPQYYTTLLLENIISNAIKYAYKNSKLNISITYQNATPVCTIQDEGIGIEATDLDAIFNPFFRSNSLKHKSIKGNGLGLSIAKKAAEIINAKLLVKSKIDVGTTFSIHF